MIRKAILGVVSCAVFFSLALVSCHKFSGSQTVPAYIHIDSITVECDYYTFGAGTSNITDAWVYVDDQIIGCYELPATFPVLKNGKHKVSVYAGICIDGIGDSRSYYPFYKPKEYYELDLVEDSVVTLNPVVTYYEIDMLNFGWKEDFETGSSLVKSPQSDTGMVRVSGAEAWNSPNSFYSGMVSLPPDSLDFCVETSEGMTFHTDLQGNFCVLEMDYKTNDTVFVGVMYYEDYQKQYWPLVKVLPSDKEHAVPQKWKKIYITLGPFLSVHESASYFKVYITSDLSVHPDYEQPDYTPISEQRYYYFDNFKVIYR